MGFELAARGPVRAGNNTGGVGVVLAASGAAGVCSSAGAASGAAARIRHPTSATITSLRKKRCMLSLLSFCFLVLGETATAEQAMWISRNIILLIRTPVIGDEISTPGCTSSKHAKINFLLRIRTL